MYVKYNKMVVLEKLPQYISEIERRGKHDKSARGRECVQYDGSKDDLDWRIDFRYLNFI